MNVSIKKRLSSIVLAGALSGALFGAPALAGVANAAPPVGSPNAPAQTAQSVTGTVTDTATDVESAFTGTISGLAVRLVDGVLTLTGTLTGTGLPAGGVDFATEILDLNATQACDVLTLNLGAIHLDVLGLVVDLSPIDLDIDAVPGSGNLLGNLVCAVTGLLDNNGGGVLNGVTALLNRLLAGLGLAL